MSIDLNIIPTVPGVISWGNLKKELRRLLTGTSNEDLLQQLGLAELHSKQLVYNREKLLLEKPYGLTMSVPNILMISVFPNTERYLYMQDYLEDYGRNLNLEKITALAKCWSIAGHYYMVTSMGGRGKREPDIFVALATAIANTCSGYVAIIDPGFDLGVGIHPPEVFQEAQLQLKPIPKS